MGLEKEDKNAEFELGGLFLDPAWVVAEVGSIIHTPHSQEPLRININGSILTWPLDLDLD